VKEHAAKCEGEAAATPEKRQQLPVGNQNAREQHDRQPPGCNRGKRERHAAQEGHGEQRAPAFCRPDVERIAAARAREHEARPGQRAAKDLGAQEIGHAPDLEVLPLQAWQQQDAQAPPAQPQAELDVLDRRLRVTLRVESARLEEGRLADRAAARPERLRLAPRLAVMEVVDEILVLRKKVRRRRRVVVRAEHRAHVRRTERIGQDTGRVAVDHDVGIDEPEHVAARKAGSDVAGAARAQPAAGADDTRSERGRHSSRSIGGAVVDDNDLGDLPRSLQREEWRQTALERRGSVVDRHDDGDGHAASMPAANSEDQSRRCRNATTRL